MVRHDFDIVDTLMNDRDEIALNVETMLERSNHFLI